PDQDQTDQPKSHEPRSWLKAPGGLRRRSQPTDQMLEGYTPYVLVGHAYGAMISREFAGRYPGQVAGMVLVDASGEPEVAVYDRLHAGQWIDGTVQPAPNQRIDIHATVRELQPAPRRGGGCGLGARAGHRP